MLTAWQASVPCLGRQKQGQRRLNPSWQADRSPELICDRLGSSIGVMRRAIKSAVSSSITVGARQPLIVSAMSTPPR
jgi:hypothetical protein